MPNCKRERAAMNDPRVVALEYRIEHGPVIDWSRAVALNLEEDSFGVRAGNGRIRFNLKKHYASEDEARSAVEADYIPNWEFHVGLTRGPNAFKLRFDRAEIVDLSPSPGPPTLSAHVSAGSPTVRADLAPPTPPAFPDPPRAGIRRSPDVDSMFHRYLGHLQGREPLSAMTYFCLTVLEQMGGGRSKAAARFGISGNVLNEIGKLSANKSGSIARKAIGSNAPYTSEQERFLKSAIQTLIRRAAEVEFGPDQKRETITLADI